jgi:hypothetical protein
MKDHDWINIRSNKQKLLQLQYMRIELGPAYAKDKNFSPGSAGLADAC